MPDSRQQPRVSGSLGRCILPLLDALGWKGGKRSFLYALPYDYRQFSVDDMMNTMANLRFKVNSAKGSLHWLDTRQLPCLFIDREKRAFVLINNEDDRFFCFDGDSSNFTHLNISSNSGTFYFFENLVTSATDPEKPQREWFTAFIARFTKNLSLTFLLSFFLSLTALLSPLIVMGIYSQISTAESIDGFWIIGLGIATILLVDFILRIFRHRLLSHLGARMGFLVSTQVFKRILSFKPSATENASIGSQIVRMRDFNTVRSFIDGAGMTSVMDLPFFILLFIGLVVMAGNLAYVPLIGLLILLIFSLSILPVIRKNNAEAAGSSSQKQAFLIEFFSEFRAIRMSGLTAKWRDKYEILSANSAMDSLKTANINSVINNFSQAIVSVAGAMTITLGVVGVLQGHYGAAVLIAAMMLVWKILSPLTTGFSVFSQSVRIKKSIDQLNRLMAMELEETDTEMLPLTFRGDISFKNVSLRYRPDYHPALLGADIAIRSGECVLLQGHDGAGKTTVLKLLMGMYEAQNGIITIDGTNIRQLPPSLLRRSIGYLPEDDVLFQTSIEKNLTYYSPESTGRDLERVINNIGLTSAIDALPEGIQTRMEDWLNINDIGSFKKRLCIARTLLSKSNILLFDEPAFGLEDAHLQLLIDELKKLKGEKTLLISSNHPAFTRLADKTFTFDMGIIV
ncbi:peptidase domain-containing ABC transporter [Desulforhopalus sp. 52FAK]